MRDYGHQILAGRKERRRFSLLSYRRFMGDYLDINGKSALGEELSQACGLGCTSIYSLALCDSCVNFFSSGKGSVQWSYPASCVEIVAVVKTESSILGSGKWLICP